MRPIRDIYEEHEWKFFFASVVLSLGGGGLVVKIVGAYTALDMGWMLSIFAASSGAVFLALQYLPEPAMRKRARRKKSPLPLPVDVAALLTTSRQQQLTDLIREGKTLRASVPATGDVSPGAKIGRMLAGLDDPGVTWPARIYEWERRVTTFLTKSAAQYKGLWNGKDTAVELPALQKYLDARLTELQTILGKL